MKYLLILAVCVALSIGLAFLAPILPSDIMSNRFVVIGLIGVTVVCLQLFVVKNYLVTATICAIFGFGFVMGLAGAEVRNANVIASENARNMLFMLAAVYGIMGAVDWWRARDAEA